MAALIDFNPSYFTKENRLAKQLKGVDTSRFPVEFVCWLNCHDYVTKLNETVKAPEAMGKGKWALPHEDEWEYACRGGKGNKQPFYFGDDIDGYQANFNGNSPHGTQRVGPNLERTCDVGSYEKVVPHPWNFVRYGG